MENLGYRAVLPGLNFNRIVKELRDKRPRAEVERDLREFIGHTPFQVIAGTALGIFIAWLWLTISGV